MNRITHTQKIGHSHDQLPRGYESISKLNTALASDNVFRELSEIYERIGARPL
jgi:hypothetical protein